MKGPTYIITYLDGNTKYDSGVIKSKEIIGGLTFLKGGTIRSALIQFSKDNPNCEILRIEKNLYQSMVKRFDERGGRPITGMGFEPKD